MSYKRIVSLIVLSTLLSSVTLAQAIPFLLLPLSPSLNAMGATGTSIPTDDPYGFLFNPAQLGYTSQTTNLSFIFYPSKVNLLGFDQFKLTGIALNLGYNFNNLVGIPLSIGFGFSNPELNFEEFRSGAKDYYNAYSFGIGIDYFVQLNAGVTYKDITSILGDQLIGITNSILKAEVSTIDYGFLLNIPVIKLIDDKLSINIIDDIPIKPYFNFSTGYSQSNIGDEVYYVDPAQSDPLPRTARLGYGISLGLDFLIDESSISVIKFDFSVDAEDILIERDMFGFEYQKGIGDIDISRNILQIKGDDKVVTHSCYRIYLMETLAITNGKFSGRGFNLSTTNGIEIRATGLLKMLGQYSSSKVFEFIANHFDLRYYRTTYSPNKLDTEMDGIALFISGLEFN
ncbi:MAG: hypothetical protein IIA49_02685 [Bacteroidetes bacterium]|nr:hypothetical protein [Bacteroidota bacterium]